MLSLLLTTLLQAADSSAALQEQLDAFTAREAVPGACLAISFDDGRLLQFASGWADVEAKQTMTVEHRLMSGSIGKTYFAAWYFDLLEEEVLAADDKLVDYLGEEDWYARLPNHDSITLAHLMHHQSGIPEHVHLQQFWDDARADVQRVWRPEELVAYILDAEPLFDAGTDWSYADTNFILAAMAMEKASGKSAYREIHRRYLGPLGLDQTLATTSNDLPGLPQGYHLLGEPGRTEALPVLHHGRMELNPQLEWAGGGYYSTTADLATWGRHLFRGEAASAPQVEASIRGAVEAKLWPGDRYGDGIIVSETPFGPGIGHSGWFPGYTAEMMYFPEHGFCIAMQANTDDVRGTGPLRRQVFEAVRMLVDSQKE
ncbi:MAG: serine hydrolase domain-containing protein [Planctomycetota bacterium]|jgi:D-alanyl-D-alanine carboxypeptidase